MNRTFGLLHSVNQFYLRSTTHDQQRLHRQIRFHWTIVILDDWYNCDISVQTSRRNPFPAKISAYNVRYKTSFFYEIHPDLLLFIFVSSPVKLFLYVWKFFENGYLLELHHLYLFIYFFTALITGDDEFAKFENIRAANCFR